MACPDAVRVGVRQEQVVETEQTRVVAGAMRAEADAVDSTEVVQCALASLGQPLEGQLGGPEGQLLRCADLRPGRGSGFRWQPSRPVRQQDQVPRSRRLRRTRGCPAPPSPSRTRHARSHWRSSSGSATPARYRPPRQRTLRDRAAGWATGTSPAAEERLPPSAGSSDEGFGLRPASGSRSSDRPAPRRRVRPQSCRRSAALRADADSSLTQVIPSRGTFGTPEMSTSVPEVRWSYPQLPMMLDLER